MSRPSTPLGISPRGSYLNLTDASSGTPLRDEKGRLRLELGLLAQNRAEELEKAKKEEMRQPVAQPGEPEWSDTPEGSLLKAAVWPILSYCCASVMMTVVNKFVVSGHHFTMTFLCKSRGSRCRDMLTATSPHHPIRRLHRLRLLGQADGTDQLYISSSLHEPRTESDDLVRDLDWVDAKAWFPISFLLVAVIYTGSKSLVCLPRPVNTVTLLIKGSCRF